MSKEKDLKFIKDFAKISVAGICKELGIKKNNVWAGKASEKTTEKVKVTIEERIKKLAEDERL